MLGDVNRVRGKKRASRAGRAIDLGRGVAQVVAQLDCSGSG
jgi:hypothetical protein